MFENVLTILLYLASSATVVAVLIGLFYLFVLIYDELRDIKYQAKEYRAEHAAEKAKRKDEDEIFTAWLKSYEEYKGTTTWKDVNAGVHSGDVSKHAALQDV